jgi:hypothetical protein
MFTTAGAARATESAKLCITTVGLGATLAMLAALGTALGAAAAGAVNAPAVRAPSNVGFHQTTRNATARPTTTALTKKFTRTRLFCN